MAALQRWIFWNCLVFILTPISAVSQTLPTENPSAAQAKRVTPIVLAVARVSKSVVSINSQVRVQRRRTPWDELFHYDDGAEGGSRFQDQGVGSGVLVDSRGYLVTNDHVIGQAARIVVKLSDGREFQARLVGDDADNDIAVLKIQGEGPFEAAPLGQSDDLMLGETTIAMGSPFGLNGSVTSGILSATNRPITFRGREVFADFLQTSTVINPGNSGGPLLNINGEVIGINVAIHSRGPGIGFAIPISRVREVLYRLLNPRFTKKAWLGLDIEHDSENSRVIVLSVDDEGPARQAGLAAGDQILKVNGQLIGNWINYCAAIDQVEPGSLVHLEVERRNERVSIQIPFAAAPTSPAERAVFNLAGFEFDDLDDEHRSRYALTGIRVTKVLKGSPAEKQELAPGDLIYNIGGYNLKDKSAAAAIIEALSKRRTSMEVRVIRDGRRLAGTIPFSR